MGLGVKRCIPKDQVNNPAGRIVKDWRCEVWTIEVHPIGGLLVPAAQLSTICELSELHDAAAEKNGEKCITSSLLSSAYPRNSSAVR